MVFYLDLPKPRTEGEDGLRIYFRVFNDWASLPIELKIPNAGHDY